MFLVAVMEAVMEGVLVMEGELVRVAVQEALMDAVGEEVGEAEEEGVAEMLCVVEGVGVTVC